MCLPDNCILSSASSVSSMSTTSFVASSASTVYYTTRPGVMSAVYKFPLCHLDHVILYTPDTKPLREETCLNAFQPISSMQGHRGSTSRVWSNSDCCSYNISYWACIWVVIPMQWGHVGVWDSEEPHDAPISTTLVSLCSDPLSLFRHHVVLIVIKDLIYLPTG